MFDLTIKTERLTLRPFCPADAPRVRDVAGAYDIAKMCSSIPHPYPEGLAEQWIGMHDQRRARGRGYPFAIDVDGELAGSIGIEDGGNGEFEIGYWLNPTYWNKGFASEAVAAVLHFAFAWRALPYVRARFLSENRASGRVLAKTGFLATGRRRVFHTVRDTEVEIVEAVLPRDAWTQDFASSNRV